MIVHCKADINRKTGSGIELEVSQKTRDAARKFLVSYTGKDNPPAIDLSINVECMLETTATGGLVSFQFLNMPDVYLEAVYNKKTKAQTTTLRGIERFIFWATEGYKSRGDRDIHYIHEALIDMYSKPVVNPVSKKEHMMRTSDPNMDTVTLSKIIEGGLNWLSTLDIPREVMSSIGRPMKELWNEWYTWRYDNKDGDPLFDTEQTYSWDDYCLVHPVCEVCGLPEAPGDPLERMHIVSKGADGTIYEFPWNWLRAHHSHHVEQHGTAEGWNKVIYEYPVIKNKVARARNLWNKHRSSK
jgi:hypothetical protein